MKKIGVKTELGMREMQKGLKMHLQTHLQMRQGTSLLIAIGLITVIVLVSLGVTTVVISSIRESSNANNASQAYYNAESAEEEALLVNQEQGGPGFTTSGTIIFEKCDGGGQCVPDTTLKGSYKITGQVPKETKYEDGFYGIPTPGTGNAGADCDSLKPYISGGFYYSPTATPHYIANVGNVVVPEGQGYYNEAFPASDHPCNWNKIRVGETVTIPLYSADKGGNTQNIFTDPNKIFKLKVRTPCGKGQELCPAIERPDLNNITSGDPKYKFNDPILTWQILGTNAIGNEAYALAPLNRFINNKWGSSDIIYEGRINNARDDETLYFEVLNQGDPGIDNNSCLDKIIFFLSNTDAVSGCSMPNWSLLFITKPVLKLTIIHSLEDTNGDNLPYLEYQLMVDGSVANLPTDTSQTITAEGFSGTFKQVLEVKQPQESGILEYVIQQ